MAPGIAIPGRCPVHNWMLRKKPQKVEREFNRAYKQEYGSYV